MRDPADTVEAPEGERRPPSASLPPGELVGGRYRLVARLGRGGAAIVHRAEDVQRDRLVALKIVEPFAVDEHTLARLKREARSVARLRHENVVETYAFGRHADTYWIAMELVDGVDLGTMLREETARERTLPFETALDVVRQIASGLGAIHAHGLLHLDVKPSNVVVERRTGRAVLVDFGIARRLAQADASSSFVGGTPSYMAPEQLGCALPENMTPRTDVYALGCTAFEVFTGRSAFAGKSIHELVLSHLSEEAPLASSVLQDLAPLDEVLARAMARSPADRFEDASTFLSELESAAARLREALSPPESGVRLVDESDATRVLVLVDDAHLRQELVATIGRALHAATATPRIECARTPGEALSAFRRRVAPIVVVDREAADDSLIERIRALPGGLDAEVIVLADGPRSSRRPELAVRELPRPVSMHVVGAVVARVAERRVLSSYERTRAASR